MSYSILANYPFILVAFRFSANFTNIQFGRNILNDPAADTPQQYSQFALLVIFQNTLQ